MVLESAMCEDLDDVETLMLRDKRITIFDDNLNDPSGENLKLADLVNIECLHASHNLIKDTLGVCQMTTLVELNLSFNAIEDITGLEELTLLRQLHLNHNKIAFIEAVRKLKGLKVLGLFANKIMESEDVIEILTSLPKLKELSIDQNPCSRLAEFRYELILRQPQLKMYDDEAIKELDRDVAQQYYTMHDKEVPIPENAKKEPILKAMDGRVKDKEQKSVRFKEANIDDSEEFEIEKDVKELMSVIDQLKDENKDLKAKLQEDSLDEVYKENEMLKK